MLSRHRIFKNLLRMLMLPMVLGAPACDNMADQPKLEAYEASEHLPKGMAAQHPPAHTRRFGTEVVPGEVVHGRVNGEFVNTIPLEFSVEDLRRGQDQYTVHCMPCHGYSGHGDGLIVRRGFPSPPSYHTDRLRRAPAGYLFTVISKGYGVMLPYGPRISVKDRWRIVAYLRGLQLSQYATKAQIPGQTFEGWAEQAEAEEAP